MKSRDLVAVILLVSAVLLAGFVSIGSGVGGLTTGSSENGTGLEFREVSEDVGFTYNPSQPSGFMSESGVYTVDYDGDGWTDILAVGEQSGPVLFDNEGGTFTKSGELEAINRSMRVAIFLDYDGDSDEDLILFPWDGAPTVLANDNGSFRRVDGVLDTEFDRAVGATAGDYNGDGCLDLFVVQNGDWTNRIPRQSGESTNTNVSTIQDNGNRNLLFRGTCGSFENATRAAGIRGSAWSLATSMVDIDGDSRPDIHIANDFNNDVIYWNDGDGTFTRAVLSDETNRNGMGSEIEDFSGNGRLDVFVTNIYLPPSINGSSVLIAEGRSAGNNLLINAGTRQFRTAGKRCGVNEGGWGWAVVGADLDNDGDNDVFHSTLEFTQRLGSGLLDARQQSPDYSYPVLFERRSGTGCEFVSRNASSAGFGVTDGHSVTQIDYDRDGDLDVAMAVSPGPTGEARYRLYENVGTAGNAVQVRLVDDRQSSTPLGARVFVTTDNGTQVRAFHSRSDYFSQEERVLHFGVGNQSEANVRVVWPNGSEQRFSDVETDTRFVISRNGVERTYDLNSSSGWPVSLGAIGLLSVLIAAVAIAVSSYRRP